MFILKSFFFKLTIFRQVNPKRKKETPLPPAFSTTLHTHTTVLPWEKISQAQVHHLNARLAC